LIGIILALLPRKGFLHIGNRKHFALGVFFGLIAALGQGAGGVLSRMAYQAQSNAVMPANTLDGILLGASAGYQRLLGGLLVIGLVYFVSKTCFTRKSQLFHGRGNDSTANKFSWLLLAALTGPVIGIIFFQWALFVTEAAIAQAIVALTPIVIIPFAYWIEGERPSPRSIFGGIIAVSGVILLMLA
jgi:drug/metabolite transporter (DMT)-like permease